MNTSLPNPLLAQYVQFDESLRGIYDRLGPSVLIPLDDDGKPLAVAASFTETQSAEYLRRLSTSNIAVRCGSPSANLCAIMFSEEQVFQTFLLSNPGLRETAVLNGPEGVILFIRIEGFRPRTTTLPFCKWLGEAATVRLCLRRKFTATYKWLNNCVASANVRNPPGGRW